MSCVNPCKSDFEIFAADLTSIAPESADDLLAQMHQCGMNQAAIIGHLAERGPIDAAIEFQPTIATPAI